MSTGVFADRFTDLRMLGRGGFGIVYRAWDTVMQGEVALKLLNADFAVDPDLRRRFEQEATAARKLNGHPNITIVFDRGEFEGQPFIVMEIVEGEALGKFVGEGLLTDLERLDLLDQLCDGLHYAHVRHIVHRDIKPANLMVRDDHDGVTARRTLKILDFGIAKMASSAMTATGGQMFSRHYVSPEQILGEPVGPRSDMFAVGAVAYELFSGRKTFDITESDLFRVIEEVKAKVVLAPHTPLSELRPNLPSTLTAAIDRALAKAPSDRFRDLAEMRGVLRGVRAELERRSANATLHARPRFQDAPRISRQVRDSAETAAERAAADRAAEEQAAAERAAAERAAEEQAAAKRAAEEQAAAERAAAERAVLERAAAERAAAARAALERATAERAAADRVALERAAAERAAAELVAEEQAAAERAAAERVALERAAAERAAAKRAAEERAAAERAAAKRVEEERATAERVAAERVAAERAAKDRATAERAAAQRMAQERAAAERAEAERAAQERAAQERAKAERAEAERVARERVAAERAAAAQTAARPPEPDVFLEAVSSPVSESTPRRVLKLAAAVAVVGLAGFLVFQQLRGGGVQTPVNSTAASPPSTTPSPVAKPSEAKSPPAVAAPAGASLSRAEIEKQFAGFLATARREFGRGHIDEALAALRQADLVKPGDRRSTALLREILSERRPAPASSPTPAAAPPPPPSPTPSPTPSPRPTPTPSPTPTPTPSPAPPPKPSPIASPTAPPMAATTPAASPRPSPPAASPEVAPETAIRNVLHAYEVAWSSRNVQALRRVVDMSATQVSDWAQMASGAESMSKSITDVKISLHGPDDATATARVIEKFKRPNSAIVTTNKKCLILFKKDGAWMILDVQPFK